MGLWDAFLQNCRQELTVTFDEISSDIVMVAENRQSMAGVAHLIVEDHTAMLEKLFIGSDFTGQGVGGLLFKKIAEEMKPL